jgi:pilus assembly protein CpaC
MLTLKWQKLLFIASICMTLATAHAADENDQKMIETDKPKEDLVYEPKGSKFIYLTLGIEQDEKYRDLPDGLKAKGDFSKITDFKQFSDRKIFRFYPKADGLATLTLHDKNNNKVAEYRIVVKKNRLDQVAREIQSLLADIEGITIKIANNKVIIDGQVLLPRDYARIWNVWNEYKDVSAIFVTMSPMSMKRIAEYIAKEINNPEIEVRPINDKIMLTGTVGSDAEKNNILQIATGYMPPVVLDPAEAQKIVQRPARGNGIIDLISVKPVTAPPPKMIQVVIHYVELSKNYNKSFRFQFMPSLKDDSGIQIKTGGASSSTGGFVSEFTATINNLIPKLNWMKSHGHHARVLQSATLLLKENESATLESFRNLPATTVIGSGQTTTTGGGKLGIGTQVSAVLGGERSDTIDLDLKFNISAPAGTAAGGPIIAENKVQTKVSVRNTQSAAVAGLIQNVSNTDYNRLPSDVSTNPILSLYASKDFVRGQSQFVVFATPVIKSSASSGAEKIKKKFRLRE